MQALDKTQRKRLRVNWHLIANLMEHEQELINDLQTRGCITPRQRQTIAKQPTSLQRETLQELILCKSLKAVDIFADCLPEKGKLLICRLLNNSGTVFMISYTFWFIQL